MKKLVLLALVFILGGCTANKVAVKAYEGPKVLQTKLALLKPTRGLVIYSINNKDYNLKTVAKFGINDYEIDLKPGNYTLKLGYNIGSHYSNAYKIVEFKALESRKYIVRSGVNGREWKPFVQDVTNKMQCWDNTIDSDFSSNSC